MLLYGIKLVYKLQSFPLYFFIKFLKIKCYDFLVVIV